MSDFNKGDFTQQGVNGHVRATLRLNEKRYVNLDLTTNENAQGCTISGNVHDRLNNLDYPIGAFKTISSKTITENGTYNASVDDCDGYNPVTVNVPQPTGNIIITENTAEGEPLNISQYATATVNVPAPAPAKHYVIPEGSYTSIIDATTGLAGIYIPNSYFFAPELFFTIDGVTKKLVGQSALYGGATHVFFTEPNDASTAVIEVYPNLLSMLSGVIIQTTDTEPTAHTVSAYYEGDKRYWQVFDNQNELATLSLLGNFLDTILTNNVYTFNMATYKQSLEPGHRSYPLEVYPSRLNGSYIIPFINDSAYTVSEIITSTTVAQDNTNYNVPTNEDNLAFITVIASVQ